jgi:hypothetical protein
VRNLQALLTDLWTARALVIVGLFYGHKPIWVTFSHIGKENYLLTPIASIQSHSYYHYFREGVGDVAATAVILAIILVPSKFRNPAMWWIMLITMLGIYAPFWVGMPFNSDLSAPHMKAEVAHLKMALPAIIGCFLAKRHYFEAH